MRVPDGLSCGPTGHHRYPPYQVIDRGKLIGELETENRTAANKAEIRRRFLERWQEEWENNRETAGWTRAIIPNIGVWLKCHHKALSYELTQVLTGHGCFRTFTCRIGKEDAPTCVYCNDGTEDTVDHTLVRCTRWEEDRMTFRGTLGAMETTKDLVDSMMQGRDKWKAGADYIQKVISAKEKEERRRQEARAEEEEEEPHDL